MAERWRNELLGRETAGRGNLRAPRLHGRAQRGELPHAARRAGEDRSIVARCRA